MTRAAALWALVGATLGLGVLTGFTIGVYVLPVGLLLAVIAAVVTRWRGLAAVLCGAGLPLLYVAWLNRGGPGERCWQTETASGCTELLNPWPWVLVAAVLIGVGLR